MKSRSTNSENSKNNDETTVLLFDGVCILCNRLVQFIIRRDKKEKFKFASLQSDKGQALLKQFGLPRNVFNSIVYISENGYLLNSSAILHICKDMEGMWKYVYILIVIPSWVRDFIYTGIAKTRYKLFGKLDVCMVPGPEIAHRFL